ncbi:rhodanese domain-containing protein CG4456-like [Amphibalanus amphitrite]|uniref:rhodanese domain-containing protein CG4456-like n=1 Tax=Amphibalanus amphitrite TaxID=1232801 RepID=UPI001C91C86F|nr:rhodanese domain-containing protein CG4456-like [Amphibalanus amphitrite]XP_043231262.1 rhodanese domain-containing protein CG4456-like [Amphibalanus amphitrite]XP_043231263.1 rhodanese domain-containing protein CG4456-like [Amphibalanus amphitrite]XP_043231264.1 rhodanese domain-containing protein CG4456-like [Amphibalanus amphitrite]
MSADFAAVKEALDTGSATVIDVRNPGELQEKGKLPKAVNVPMTELKEAMELSPEEFQNKYGFVQPSQSDALIVHCNRGGRAARAATQLTESGFSNVRLYQGSFNDWVSNGGPLEK